MIFFEPDDMPEKSSSVTPFQYKEYTSKTLAKDEEPEQIIDFMFDQLERLKNQLEDKDEELKQCKLLIEILKQQT